jgi:hypothetical protein
MWGTQFGGDGQSGDVDAVGGEEVGVGGEVDGGDGVTGAVAAAGCGVRVDGEGTVEEGAGVAELAFGDEGADAAGGDGRAAQGERGVDGDAEVEGAAEFGEGGDVGLGVVAEAEVFALVDLGDVEGVAQDGLREVVGGGVAESFGEGQDEGGVEAGGGEEFELAWERGDEGEGLRGAEDAGGVGVEGDGEGLAAEEARAGR